MSQRKIPALKLKRATRKTFRDALLLNKYTVDEKRTTPDKERATPFYARATRKTFRDALLLNNYTVDEKKSTPDEERATPNTFPNTLLLNK